MIFHGSEIWEMLHCIFINSLQDGYNADIWYCCFWLLKILKGSTIIGHLVQRFVNFMINMSVFGSKILKMLYCTFVKFLPDGYDKLWYFIMLFWLGRNSDWVTLNGSVLWRKVCKSSINTSFLSKIWVMLHCTSLNLNRRIILQWTWVDGSSNWVAPKGMFYTKKIAIFDQFLGNDIGHPETPVAILMQFIEWCHFQWPCETFEGHCKLQVL